MMNIAVFDFETDPFKYREMVYPFATGWYDGKRYIQWWGADCVERFVEFLRAEPEPWLIYAHNGGKFDFYWMVPHLLKQMRIVNGRIIQCYLGKHEIRDSLAIMPFSLATYKKTKIDYELLAADRREKNKDEILAYLRDDCIDLYTLCVAFREEFGDNLTIGSAALKQLKKFHSFKSGNNVYDDRLRKLFYFGGRNQVFESGVIRRPVKVFDVNSMYPDSMKEYLHPVSTGIYTGKEIDERTCFLEVEGWNRGAFPTRTKDNSLDFTVPFGTFYPSIHEWHAAMDTGTFKVKRIIKTYGWSERVTFGDFVDTFYQRRLDASARGDKIRKIFYKYVLNSSYGKFAQNPENYCDWYLCEMGEYPPGWHDCTCKNNPPCHKHCSCACEDPCRLRWIPSITSANMQYVIWSRPIKECNYYNVATGASITGAARAMLLRGLHGAINPIYCDTDSIICSGIRGVKLSDSDLGAWKLEATGSGIAVAGKKTYAIWRDDFTPQEVTPEILEDSGYTLSGDRKRLYIKKAHKGVRISGDEIIRAAQGETIEYCNPVPQFHWDGTYSFTKRRIRATST